MASPHLQNYLIANRKRLSLSQDEVAFLLGAQGGAKVSRYERFAREPSLKTVLAFEVIYQRPASELFAGLYRQVEGEVAVRAKALAAKAARGKSNPQSARRRQSFTNIANNSYTLS